jgi:hypothetical protein
MRSLLFVSFVAVFVCVSHVIAAEAPDGTTFTHTVLSVDGPDLVRIKYCGLPLQLRLANVQTKGGDTEAQGLKYLRESLHPGTLIRIELEPELNPDGTAVPTPAHIFVGNTHVNLEMLKRGFAITDGRTRKFVTELQTAQTAAMNSKVGVWAPGAAIAAAERPAASATKTADIDVAPPDYGGSVIADLNSKEYLLPGSRFAKSIRTAARIEYKSPDEAERAGKLPSPFSFPDRAKALSEKSIAKKNAAGGASTLQSTEAVVENSRKSLSDALVFMNEARKLSRNDSAGANMNWKKAAKLITDSLDRLTPVADANPNNADIQKLAEELTLNLYSCNKYQSL